MSAVAAQPLSRLVLEMNESATIKMAQMARDLKSKGHDVIDLPTHRTTIGHEHVLPPKERTEDAGADLDTGSNNIAIANRGGRCHPHRNARRARSHLSRGRYDVF